MMQIALDKGVQGINNMSGHLKDGSLPVFQGLLGDGSPLLYMLGQEEPESLVDTNVLVLILLN